jgi:hypothetical protein
MVSYPHPVLGNTDDVAAEFLMTNFTYRPLATHVHVAFDVRCDDPDAVRLVEEGQAVLALRILCGRTFYNSTTHLASRRTDEGWECRLGVDVDLLDGTTTAELLLLADRPLERFSWGRQHPDFFDETFDVPARAVIATGGEAVFDVRKSYDPLRPPLESFMSFNQDSEHKEEFRVFVRPEGIDVRIGRDAFEDFRALGAAPALQINAVVLPALTQALTAIYDEELDEETRQSPWYQGVRRILADHDLDEEATALERAQTLLKSPLRMLLQADVLGLSEGENDDA